MEKWTKEIAKIWRNYFPPCRPSKQEIEILNILSQDMITSTSNKIDVLILGSTSEFRIWAESINANVVIIDNSIEYHEEISKEIDFEIKNEILNDIDWLEMEYEQEFDIIVGDLIIGNLPSDKIIEFLKRVRRAMKQEGMFITKSFFYDPSFNIISPEVMFHEYEKNHKDKNPFQFNIYNLAMYCTNTKNFMMEFKDMYAQVLSCFQNGIIDENTFNTFKNLGWSDEMKNKFYMMPIELWEKILKDIFGKFEIIELNEYWGANFPIYVISK